MWWSTMRERYRTIVADPPWEHPGTGVFAAGWRAEWAVVREAPLAYRTLSVEAIAALPVADFTERDCRMFLWATNTRMPDAYSVLAAWGFTYKQTLVWRKPDANPVGGSLAPNAEFLIVGTVGSPSVGERLGSPVVEHPRGGLVHSQKPDLFLDIAERVSPAPRLEMFARRQRLGWDTWGNEALEHVEIAS